MNKIKLIFNKIKEFICSNDVELAGLISAFFIVYASFLINKILAFYVLGFIFGGLAIFLLKYPKK
ncbi:hypothetical protein OD350_24880 [Clostridium beijerinckii]|uniref:Uncharacterized protein n=1 Tax=Clostridium beijerinckii TaxID=1520 RepID=A0AAX0B6W6_CLOBE|nr:hypothetical protein [Clostridium beijerinckii]NRT90188.1 hypothetical protein [Clostridium beijerinckii]NYC69718.1 hypothetical protein [Clostridium beijerinckii]UYZ35407.1 hypothetical protein OD350_24880 [Clostridium beijerinckii]